MIEVFDEANEQKEVSTIITLLDRSATRFEIIEHFNKLTIHDVVGNEDYKSIRALARTYEKEAVINGIAVLFRDTSKAYDKSWSVQKAKEAALELYYSEYSFITLEDVFVLLKRIKENDFSFTPASLSKQLKKYVDERFEVAKKQSLNSHYANKFTDVSERIKDVEIGKHRKALSQHQFNNQLKKEGSERSRKE